MSAHLHPIMAQHQNIKFHILTYLLNFVIFKNRFEFIHNFLSLGFILR